MPTTKTGYWIRVKNGEVTDVWDTTPDYQNQAGWREAVEVFPDVTPNREIITTHSFDLNANPAQIVWAKREVTMDERKGALSGQAKQIEDVVISHEGAPDRLLGSHEVQVGAGVFLTNFALAMWTQRTVVFGKLFLH